MISTGIFESSSSDNADLEFILVWHLEFFCQTKISILTIDIGFKHTSICEWNPNNKKYKIYLFSVDSD